MNENKWLMLSYRVPAEPSRKRVYVWRKLKELGAVYIQQGVGILPHTESYVQTLQTLRQEIMEMDGDATLAGLSVINEEDEQKLINEFRKLR